MKEKQKEGRKFSKQAKIRNTLKLIICSCLAFFTKSEIVDKTGLEYQALLNRHLMVSSKFDLNTLSSNEYFFIKLDDYHRVTKWKRVKYIHDIISTYRNQIISIRPTEKVNVTELMSFDVLTDANHSYAEGVIPVKVTQKKSYDGFKADVSVNHLGNWTKTDGQYRRARTRILGDPFTETTFFMSSWLIPKNIAIIFTVLAIILKCIVVLIQLFLVVIRPCFAKRNTMLFDWTISFASSLMWIQLYLMIALISQNFGGALNHPINEMMRASRGFITDHIHNNFFDGLSKQVEKYKGAGFWKLAINGYVPSPILEHWLGSLLLVLSLVAVVICPSPDDRDNHLSDAEASTPSCSSIIKEFQTGVILSFMVPLNIAAVNCIYGVWNSGLWDTMGMLSFIFSIFILVYYLYFAVQLLGGSKTPIYSRYYNHLNFDFPRFYSKVFVSYCEYLCLWLITLIQVIFANQNLLPIILTVIIQYCLFVFLLATPTRAKADDFMNLSKINIWKKVNIFCRTLLLFLMLLFMYFDEKATLPFIMAFTMIAMCLILFDFIGYLIVLWYRVKGICRTGMRDPYPDYIDGEYRHFTAENNERDWMKLEGFVNNKNELSRLSGRSSVTHGPNVDFRSRRAEDRGRRKGHSHLVAPPRSIRSRVSGVTKRSKYTAREGDWGFDYLGDNRSRRSQFKTPSRIGTVNMHGGF